MAATTPRTALAWEYSPAPEATDHIRLRDRYELFVDGAWRPPESGAAIGSSLATCRTPCR